MLEWNTGFNDGLHTGQEQLLLVEVDDKGWPYLRVEPAENCDGHDGKWLPASAVIKYLDGEILDHEDLVPVCAECMREPCQCQSEPTLSQLIDGLRLEWREARGTHYARQGFWQYSVRQIGNGYVWAFVPGDGTRLIEMFCDSIDDGKAACESDYKQRVRAIFKGV